MVENENEIEKQIQSHHDTELQPIAIEECEIRFEGYKAKTWNYIEITFGFSYWNTSLSLIIISFFILRLFDHTFQNVGLVFISLGGTMLFIALFRRRKHLKHMRDRSKPFVTSGGYVLFTGFIFMSAYFILLVMIATLKKK
ncbi:hypothetical protein F8M41_018732 [Gigaspora margarita]|uniref:DUF202 domain-containing protein n=1 Tax=Gigaspora margarita TaxID=4874 RepID=A0A8H4AL97_GIGMA|nr:hypothetical protein F8M41_018732 [Gigaspora margarita]